jgi:hypothetical protein
MRTNFLNDAIVLLGKFNGCKSAPLDVDEGENFWKLIGKRGQILSTSPPKYIGSDRVLVKFEDNLDELDLPNHNETPNTLWIKVSDLIAVKT